VNECLRSIDSVMSAYFEAFAHDPAAASAFYGEPVLIVTPTQVITLAKRADVEAVLDKTLRDLKILGYSHTQMAESHTRMLNANSALYEVVAERLKADQTIIERSGFTYCLQKGEDGWKIHILIFTDLDKLMGGDAQTRNAPQQRA
jgi:ketosteroid isomerase-like protein